MKIENVEIWHRSGLPAEGGKYHYDEITAAVDIDGLEEQIRVSIMLDQGNIYALSEGLGMLGEALLEKYKEAAQND